MTTKKASKRRIPASMIRGSIVAGALVLILATFGLAITHLSAGLVSHPVPTSHP